MVSAAITQTKERMGKLVVTHYNQIVGRISGWLARRYLLPKGDRFTVAAAAVNEIIAPIIDGRDHQYGNLDQVEAAAKALAGEKAKNWLADNLGSRMRDF